MILSEAIGGIFSGVVKPVLDKWIPDAKDRLEAEQAIFKGLQAINEGQLEINKVEAASPNLLVAGWRPFIGWVCGVSFAYSVIGWTFLNWAFALATTYSGHTLPVLPLPDTALTMELLMAMLGLGGLRTYEKFKGLTK